MHARVHHRGADTDSRGELPERLVHAAAGQARADTGQEERPGSGSGTQPVPLGGVVAQRFRARRVQRHQPGTVELRVADRDDTGGDVDVVAAQADRFAQPHPGHGEQPEQRLVCRRPQRWAQRPGRFQQPTDVAGRPQVGGRAVPRGGEHPGRWHPGRRVDRAQIACEPARDGQSLGPVVGLGPFRQSRPGDRQVAGHGRGPSRLQIGHQLGKQDPIAFELEPERPTQQQVVLHVRTQPGHGRTPVGHRAASPRSRSTSTLA